MAGLNNYACPYNNPVQVMCVFITLMSPFINSMKKQAVQESW